MHKCSKKQICNVCEGTFKMERGCNLEKRCPACRFLGLQKGMYGSPYVLGPIPVDTAISYVIKKREKADASNNYSSWEISQDVRTILGDILPQLSGPDLINIKIYIKYLHGYTPTELAKELEVSTKRVHQRLHRAIITLKHQKLSRRLKTLI